MQTGFLLPTAICAVAGGVDGAISGVDADHGRTEFIKQWSTYYQAGLVVAGGALGFFGAHPDVYEPLLFAPAVLASRRAGFALVERNQKTPTPAYGRRVKAQPAGDRRTEGRRTEARPEATSVRVMDPFDQPVSPLG